MLTRTEANTIYRAYKNNSINVAKAFINAMYKTVGMSAYALRHESKYNQTVAYNASVAAMYILDEGRYDLAQAIIDGKRVEQVIVTETIREFEVTQDVLDDPEAYGIDEFEIMFYEIGETYAEEYDRIDYVIK